MDHHLISAERHDDQLEQVPGAVGSGEKVAPGIVVQVDSGDGVDQCVLDVLVDDAVAPSRLVDLHTG